MSYNLVYIIRWYIIAPQEIRDMAKLEDQVTPAELLNIIRGGTTKKEVIKQFRTSEQELAMMLLPLYRSRELSMEEFNDFFKGVPLKPKEAPSDDQAGEESPRPEDEPPSQILRSLSAKAEAGDREEQKRLALALPEAPLEQTVPLEPPPVAPAKAKQEEFEAEEVLEETDVVEEFEEEPDIEAEAVIKAREELVKPEPVISERVPAEPKEKAVVEPKPEPAEPTPAPSALEPAVLRSALEAIIARLTSIDHRLARIEKNLKSQ
jgi:hypothetical protein